MSNKLEALKKAVFYAHEKPEELAEILNGAVSDVATTVVLSGADSIEIPSGDTPNTEDYTAKVFSQFGDEMVGQTVTIALKESVTGVSISSGTVSVAKTATAESFVLKATCGTVVAEMTVALTAEE
jgi:hypothetical protein